jgi:hypothetical protein
MVQRQEVDITNGAPQQQLAIDDEGGRLNSMAKPMATHDDEKRVTQS